MAGRMLMSAVKSMVKPSKCGQKILAASYSDHDPPVLVYDIKKGREVVGFGVNGTEGYYDAVDFPYPAIRFKKTEGALVALKEKEKGDWKNLTKEEKKALYRASFCQTFAEIEAPTGLWKQQLAQCLFAITIAMWIFIWEDQVVPRKIPETLSLEHRQKMVKAIIDAQIDPITGLASKWDYEKEDWKS